MPASAFENVQALGKSNLPDGGFLLLPNRLALRGILSLQKIFDGREVAYLVESGGEYDADVKAFLDGDDVDGAAFDLVGTDLEELRKEVHSQVSKGKVVVCVPAPTVTRVGAMTDVPPKVYEFLLKVGVPTVALSLERPGDTSLCIDDCSEPTAVFSFGEPLTGESITFPAYQESLLMASEATFSKREFLGQHLAFALLRGLKKHSATHKVADGMDGSELPFGKLLAAAIALSKYIRKQTSKDRVAIVLPPGKGGILANVAVLFAGKVPVNLNFTASRDAIKSSMEQSGADKMITADPFVRKMQKFPWPPNNEMILLDRILPPMKKNVVWWLLLSKMLPAEILAKMIGVPEKGGDEEAVLLFTSGSSGDPKGGGVEPSQCFGKCDAVWKPSRVAWE